ncbi:MAG TPA: Uma2 family endonuclease [Verrucomicrobiae bacterium]|nr:Uma2 family endonuclease [Verrucomicrobiae bacterium]
MLTATAPPKPKAAGPLLTSEEFLDWLQPGVHADLIEGKIFMHSPVSRKHSRLVNFLSSLLTIYLEQEDLGELHREVVAVRLGVRETFLPDLAYFTKGQVARLAETHAPFAPTFVAEVLSPSTASNDTEHKFAAYEAHGVQEYWILDPQKLAHRFYRRAGDMFEEFAVDDDRVDSVGIPGFWVERSWLNPGKLPKVSDCLAKILPARRHRSKS